jgi:hypothetical protein
MNSGISWIKVPPPPPAAALAATRLTACLQQMGGMRRGDRISTGTT